MERARVKAIEAARLPAEDTRTWLPSGTIHDRLMNKRQIAGIFQSNGETPVMGS